MYSEDKTEPFSKNAAKHVEMCGNVNAIVKCELYKISLERRKERVGNRAPDVTRPQRD